VDEIDLPDHIIARLLPEIDRGITRPRYEDLLVANKLYTYHTLREDPDYYKMNKRQLIARTFQEKNTYSLLLGLDEEGALSDQAHNILANLGIELGQSVAGEIAEPAIETSRLESQLRLHGKEEVMHFLEQSLDNYVRGDYEASNAMSRTALESFVRLISEDIARMRGGENIPTRRAHVSPSDFRLYLRNRGFLDNDEKEFLDKFYGYASTDGSHPGISTEAESRLRKMVVVGICLLYLEKLSNKQFMASLI
jgi:hypothetical protein